MPSELEDLLPAVVSMTAISAVYFWRFPTGTPSPTRLTASLHGVGAAVLTILGLTVGYSPRFATTYIAWRRA